MRFLVGAADQHAGRRAGRRRSPAHWPRCARGRCAMPRKPSPSQIRARMARRVLADAGGEDQRVDARRGPRPARRSRAARARRNATAPARGARVVAGLEVAHVLADAGHALQPGIAVEQLRARAAASMPSVVIRCSSTPGSIWPQRVPIGTPSSAVKPMVLSHAAAVVDGAQRGAVAEMRDHDAPGGQRGVAPRPGCARCIRRTGRGSRSGGCRGRRSPAAGRRCRPPRHGRGGRRCRSRRPAARRGSARAAAAMPARLCGWCSGASGTSARSRAITASSTSTGAARSGPPCTTRWPTAATRRPRQHAVQPVDDDAERRARGCPAPSPSSQRWSASTRAGGVLRGEARRGADALDLAGERATRRRPPTSKTANLIEDEPALRTRTASPVAIRRQSRCQARLRRCAANGRSSTASAADISRACSSSARLVSITGTLAAEHEAAGVGLRRGRSAAWPACCPPRGSARSARRRGRRRSEGMPLVRAASRSTALSIASGPSTSAALDLPALGHLGQHRGVERRGDGGVDRLDRREDADARRRRCRWRARGRSRSARCRPWSSGRAGC